MSVTRQGAGLLKTGKCIEDQIVNVQRPEKISNIAAECMYLFLHKIIMSIIENVRINLPNETCILL